MRPALLVGVGVVAAGVAGAGLVLVRPREPDVPRYVAGPASGLQHECRQAGQAVPGLDALVTTVADVDGDGMPDHVMDAGRGCEAVRLLYCNQQGCTISVYASSISGYAGGEKARQVAVDRTSRPAGLVLTLGAAAPGVVRACEGAKDEWCAITLRWDGSAMAPGK